MVTIGSIDALKLAVETASSSVALLKAVEALAAAQNPEAVSLLVAALGYNNPGVAVAAVDGLIAIAEPAVLPLLALLDDQNYAARAWAIRAIAGIGDPRGLNVLMNAVKDDFAFSVRRAAARGLGSILWHSLPTDSRTSQQLICLEVLLFAIYDPEWVVRYAAVAGLQDLARSLALYHSPLLSRLVPQLEALAQHESVLAVQARILLAIQDIHTLIHKQYPIQMNRQDLY